MQLAYKDMVLGNGFEEMLMLMLMLISYLIGR